MKNWLFFEASEFLFPTPPLILINVLSGNKKSSFLNLVNSKLDVKKELSKSVIVELFRFWMSLDSVDWYPTYSLVL
ncbi:hypothetical protein D9M69_650160 [compost metagenome]